MSMSKPFLIRLIMAILLPLCSLILSGCASSYPEIEPGFESDWQAQPHEAQVYLIPSASEALARRIDAIRHAQQSIDITYFSWNQDLSGLMLLNELKLAADRGVQVRIILDDLLVFNETWLAELAQHQNIALRIFNPFHSRKTGWLGRSLDFERHKAQLDNRLHEKYFNVDGQVMILGGRNIGDNYFGYSQEANFFDLDVVFKGDILQPFMMNYRQLWNSDLLSPIEQLIHTKGNSHYRHFDRAWQRHQDEQPQVLAAISASLADLPTMHFIRAQVTPVFDSLNKVKDNKPYFRSRVEHLMNDAIANAKKAVISTPYLIPTQHRYDIIETLTKQNTQVTLITNSSASNDSAFIPAYFEQYRPELLAMGVDLYEFRDDAINTDHLYHVATYYHNKTFIFDDKLAYVGSSNFDPRSNFLNIEFGVVIDSPAFAEALTHYLLARKADLYWHVTLAPDGSISWHSGEETHDASPNYGGWHKLPDWFIRQLDSEFEL
ncbi:phospholipase D-like domain-containing protein [Shewanella sp. KCT]|uniref:phospholipase D-like domain-containing protein n=1 Tax=Shewanella sp. KCT TaxID=2569535 RepID=UPI0011832443|nr:phospholipase D family protein [Shewanella sp. KCT]TVP14604.1 phospholipase [Shewanella sp. KCT]